MYFELKLIYLVHIYILVYLSSQQSSLTACFRFNFVSQDRVDLIRISEKYYLKNLIVINYQFSTSQHYSNENQQQSLNNTAALKRQRKGR